MGVPIQTPMGATGGAGVFTAIDNGAELTAIATSINTLNTTLLALVAEMKLARNTIANLQQNVSTLAQNSTAVSKAVGDLNSSVGSVSVAVTEANTTQQTLAASIIKNNNFTEAVTKQSLTNTNQEIPALPDVKEQIKTALEDGFIMHQISAAQNYIQQKIKDQVTNITTWITESAAYQTVTDWVKRQKDSLLAAVGIKSVEKAKTDVAASTGAPSVPS
jgi:ABC-type antimicrobial peptide transport system ATPase subunit